jgi:hypothetical protein
LERLPGALQVDVRDADQVELAPLAEIRERTELLGQRNGRPVRFALSWGPR